MEDQMRRTIKLAYATALLFSIAGCSKLKNTEWLDMDRGWRVKLAASTASVEDCRRWSTLTVAPE